MTRRRRSRSIFPSRERLFRFALPWRPGELPAPEHVEVQVIHTLPRILARVRHDAIAPAIQSELLRHFGGECKGAAKDSLPIPAQGVAYGGDVAGRNHQDV